MEGIENIEKGGVSVVKLVVLGDKALENGKIGPEDFGLLMDLGGLIPGLLALKNSGKELLDIDDVEQVKLTASFEAAAGDGSYAGIGNRTRKSRSQGADGKRPSLPKRIPSRQSSLGEHRSREAQKCSRAL